VGPAEGRQHAADRAHVSDVLLDSNLHSSPSSANLTDRQARDGRQNAAHDLLHVSRLIIWRHGVGARP